MNGMLALAGRKASGVALMSCVICTVLAGNLPAASRQESSQPSDRGIVLELPTGFAPADEAFRSQLIVELQQAGVQLIPVESAPTPRDRLRIGITVRNYGSESCQVEVNLGLTSVGILKRTGEQVSVYLWSADSFLGFESKGDFLRRCEDLGRRSVGRMVQEFIGFYCAEPGNCGSEKAIIPTQDQKAVE